MKRLLAVGLVLVLTAAASAEAPFRTVAVKRGPIERTVIATGTLEPEDVIDVGAQVQGVIEQFGTDPNDPQKTIDYGTHVEEGTVLAQIDPKIYKNRVDQARLAVRKTEAELGQARAKVEQTRVILEGIEALRRTEPKTVTPQDVLMAKADCEAAKAALAVVEINVAQARTELEAAEINLSYTTIKSPVKGVILDRRVNVGQAVSPNLNAPSLFLIAKDLGKMQVWASVNEADIADVKPGQPVTFTVDAYPGEVFKGKVAQVRLNASNKQDVVTYTVVIDTDNRGPGGKPGRLLPNMTARVRITAERRLDALLVPAAAVSWRPEPKQVVPQMRAAYEQFLREEEKVPALERLRAPRGTGLVWVEDRGLARPIVVRLGSSDGERIEIIEKDERLPKDAKVIVGGLEGK
jgi:HlyD family secretion protein